MLSRGNIMTESSAKKRVENILEDFKAEFADREEPWELIQYEGGRFGVIIVAGEVYDDVYDFEASTAGIAASMARSFIAGFEFANLANKIETEMKYNP
jgi:hypothetical protein